MFRPLSREDIRQIVEIQFGHIQHRLDEARIRLVATDEVLDYLGEQGYDPQFGARPLKRVIQRQVLNELSKEILLGKISKDSVVEATFEDGQIRFNNIDVEIPTGE
ncbi:ATP-dependent Clp protease ATP-binding subunit ClpA [Pontibacter aydingkolensis]